MLCGVFSATGNAPRVVIGVSPGVSNITADSPSAETQNAVLSPKRAFAFVRHVELYLPEGTCAPVAVPAGTYRRVDVRFEPADESSASVPSDLKGATLFAAGQYTGAGASNFDLRVAFNEDARFESRQGIELTAGGINELVLGLDLNAWFDAASLEQCVSDDSLEVVDGRLRIDEDNDCSSLEDSLKDALKSANRMK